MRASTARVAVPTSASLKFTKHVAYSTALRPNAGASALTGGALRTLNVAKLSLPYFGSAARLSIPARSCISPRATVLDVSVAQLTSGATAAAR